MLDVSLFPRNIEFQKKEHIAVIIDVFRASTTICSAFASGAAEIIPVATVEEAWQIKDKNIDALLCGERGGLPPPHFDLGNSPLEYSADKVTNKSLIMTTTNGTAALYKAPENTIRIFSCFANIPMTYKFIDEQNPASLTFICAGNNGGFSYEDALCAGMMASYFTDGYELTDEALASVGIYAAVKDRLANILHSTSHARTLHSLGLSEDVLYCSSIGTLSSLPFYNGSVITDISKSTS